jgi:hypothetical protein
LKKEEESLLKSLASLGFLAFRLGGGRFLMDGTHAPEKFEIRKQVLPRMAFLFAELISHH